MPAAAALASSLRVERLPGRSRSTFDTWHCLGTCFPRIRRKGRMQGRFEGTAMETPSDSVLSSGDEKRPIEAVVPLISDTELAADSAVALEDSTVVKPAREPMRDCTACKVRIPKAYRTCPHCNKFLGDAEVVE